MPKRIQRRRLKGWRLPRGAVVVTRPGLFGNPFNGLKAIEAYRKWLRRRTVPASAIVREIGCNLVQLAPVEARYDTATEVVAAFDQIRGRDLACFCPLGQPCHADVLLEMANAAPRSDFQPIGLDELRRQLQAGFRPFEVRPVVTVRGDIPGSGLIARRGTPYRALVNRNGAVAAVTEHGTLGLKPDEFQVLAWEQW